MYQPYRLVSYYCLIIMSMFFIACNEEEEARVAELEQKYKSIVEEKAKDEQMMNAMLSEMDEINTIVDSIYVLENTDRIDRLTATDKVRDLDSTLTENRLRVDSLYNALDKAVAKVNPALQRELERYRTKVASREQQLKDLSKSLSKSRRRTVSLKRLLAERDRTIANQDKELARLEKEKREARFATAEAQRQLETAQQTRQELESEISSLKTEKVALEKEGKQTRESQADMYYRTGMEMYRVAEKMNGLFNGKKKGELVRQAHDLFERSSNLGNLSARRQALLVKEENGKYLK